MAKRFYSKCLYAITLVNSINFYTYIVLLGLFVQSSLYWRFAVPVIFCSAWWAGHRRREEDIKAERLKSIESKFAEINAYLEDRRALLEPSTEETAVLQYCLSIVAQQCLAAKQTAEAIYCDAQASASSDKLRNIEIWLNIENARIFLTILRYLVFKDHLEGIAPEEQMKAAQDWAAEIIGLFPEFSVDAGWL